MQPYEEIEKSYETPDPWGFQSNPEDAKRKARFIEVCKEHAPGKAKRFKKALDIGAGEGWITKDLPARAKHAFELSRQAAARLPKNVKDVPDPRGGYDLVTACGVLYTHYNHQLFFDLMRDQVVSGGVVVTCNIKAWEHKSMSDRRFIEETLGLEQIHEETFAYREYVQQLRVFRKK